MNLLRVLSFFVALTLALDEETKAQIRTTFQVINENTKLKSQSIPLLYDGPYVTNLQNEFYFYKKERDVMILAIVAPENEKGGIIASLMIADVSYSYGRYGFSRASSLLQYSLFTFFTMDVPEEGKVAALYVTRESDILELVSSGLLWAGLYREGFLFASTQPIIEDHIVHLSPEEYFHGLDEDGMFNIKDYNTRWDVQNGDILVVTWANLPTEFPEIVQIAVETAEKNGEPVSSIVSNLKAYFNIGSDVDKAFVALRIT